MSGITVKREPKLETSSPKMASSVRVKQQPEAADESGAGERGRREASGGEEAIAPPNENTMRIMVISDTHLGFMEDDPIRGNDSFVTFEEALQAARDHRVDFLLHGGDLFHDNKPSRKTIHRTMELMRTYCLGDRPVKVSVLSDQKLNFANVGSSSRFHRVNYEDPNFNVDLPFFTVHGNHDDPAGSGALSALDLLSVANFVNYFGKVASVDNIALYPILLQKGLTRVALYGLGNIRDERLHRTFQQQKVRMMRPVEERDSWFNIMILHQNRSAHSPKNCIQEVFLESWLDMVIWGHEHECLINATKAAHAGSNFFISQPGSSVATSLSDGEARQKCYGILEIREAKFRMRAHPFKTVRPLAIETIQLSAVPRLVPEDGQALLKVLVDRVKEIVAAATLAAQGTRQPMPPLVRLKVEYSGGFSTVAAPRFGQSFVGQVANPSDILLFFKKRTTTGAGTRKKSATNAKPLEDTEMGVLESLRSNKQGEQIDIESTIAQLMSESVDHPLVLGELELNQALRLFVDKDDKDAICECVKKQLNERAKALLSDGEAALANDGAVREWLERDARARREAAKAAAAADGVVGQRVPSLQPAAAAPADDFAADDPELAGVGGAGEIMGGGDDDNNDGDENNDGFIKVSSSSAAKKTPAAKAVKAEKGTKRVAAAAKSSVLVLSDDDDDEAPRKKAAPAKSKAVAKTKATVGGGDDDDNGAAVARAGDADDNDDDDADDGAIGKKKVKEEPSSKRARTSSTAPAANAALLNMDLKSEFPSQRSTTRTNTLKSWMAQRK
jgi:double-strand break repair protein MRE11